MVEKIKDLGWGVAGFLGFMLLITFQLILFSGGVWLITKILPWIVPAVNILVSICILIFLPLSFFKKTREFSGTAFLFSSYFFGFNLWLASVLVTYYIWGLIGLLIGLGFAGVGVFPLSVVASLLQGEWTLLIKIIYLAILTFGSWFLSFYIIKKVQSSKTYRKNKKVDDYKIKNKKNEEE